MPTSASRKMKNAIASICTAEGECHANTHITCVGSSLCTASELAGRRWYTTAQEWQWLCVCVCVCVRVQQCRRSGAGLAVYGLRWCLSYFEKWRRLFWCSGGQPLSLTCQQRECMCGEVAMQGHRNSTSGIHGSKAQQGRKLHMQSFARCQRKHGAGRLAIQASGFRWVLLA